MKAATASPHPLRPGPQAPLGAWPRAGGVDVAVHSQHAEAIELCLFDEDGLHEHTRLALHPGEDGVFHGRLEGAGPGLVYGLRAHGPYRPEAGLRFNPAKLLLDPYARALVGHFSWRPEHLGWAASHPQGRRPDPRDNAAFALKARVPEPPAPLADGLVLRPARQPRRPLRERVLYELVVPELGGLRLRAVDLDPGSHARHRPGTAVTVSWNPEDLLLFDADLDPGSNP